jgi:hypothetical protein
MWKRKWESRGRRGREEREGGERRGRVRGLGEEKRNDVVRIKMREEISPSYQLTHTAFAAF